MANAGPVPTTWASLRAYLASLSTEAVHTQVAHAMEHAGPPEAAHGTDPGQVASHYAAFVVPADPGLRPAAKRGRTQNASVSGPERRVRLRPRRTRGEELCATALVQPPVPILPMASSSPAEVERSQSPQDCRWFRTQRLLHFEVEGTLFVPLCKRDLYLPMTQVVEEGSDLRLAALAGKICPRCRTLLPLAARQALSDSP